MQFNIRTIPLQGQDTLVVVDETGAVYGGMPFDEDGAMEDMRCLLNTVRKAFTTGFNDQAAGVKRAFSVERRGLRYRIEDDRGQEYGSMDVGFLFANSGEAKKMLEVVTFTYGKGREYALDHSMATKPRP